MRYRKLDENDDYSFGNGSANFYINEPMAVAQAAETRLRLLLGEWFIDTTDGTPWNTEILGTGTESTRDLAVQDRVLGTTGLNSILGYQSSTARQARVFSVALSLDTVYGPTTQDYIYDSAISAAAGV